MIKISLPWIIEAIRALYEVEKIADGSELGQVFGTLYLAQDRTKALLTNSLYSGSISAARQAGNELDSAITEVLKGEMRDAIDLIQLWTIKSAATQFRTVLMAEVGTFPCYFVLTKPPYDTDLILEAGESVFPPDLGTKVPEAVFDAREAGKALAYELATACGFHSFRVLESVVRAFLRQKAGSDAEPRQRNLGVYIRALKSTDANPKTIAALTQIKDLHRNPVAHPDVALTLNEATSILGVVHSAVSSMLNDLPTIRPTTTTISQSE